MGKTKLLQKVKLGPRDVYFFGPSFILILLTLILIYVPFVYEKEYPLANRFDSSDTLFSGAIDFLTKDSLEQALKYLKEVARLEPNFAQPHYYLGICYEKMGRFNEATQEYHKTTQLDMESYNGYYRLGSVFSSLGRYAEAILAFKEAIIRKPYETQAYENLARIYVRLNDFKSAEKVYEDIHRLKNLE